ncbi:mannitol dehydrogenase family protein [Pseudactinotalea sp. HY158]|uniref:mannitol dehydrogenase family protein n=1 Tax=Pseudactinotalea sp. HY158 TaxID=2654547 RepID=UPI00129C612D|nr:mannitol dehydrogenase family protein [Pseudactinotalea sp. HY158]QGH69985.1 mannitol dehydrogenase family protein [Pseudactinotalea sp. HY158]
MTERSTLRLTAAALPRLRERGEVAVPDYDRSAITAGIAHVGVGGFHRAHQAKAIDDLLRAGLARDWGIVGIGLMPGDAAMRDALAAQDHLYTLVEKRGETDLQARVIGSIVDYLFAPEDPGVVLERLADPAIRIVSLTVTEGGYNINQVTGEFMLDDPHVAHDLGSGLPETVFGYITAALRLRRERGIRPFTVMSCDNLQDNGVVARRAILTFARAKDPELADWIGAHVAFPNSMVDRITPVTTDADRAALADGFGVEDAWPVVAEPFFQWVLQDTFTDGRPPYEEAGVQVVTDVTPYELMKLRLLNSSHQGLCYFGALMGYHYAHDATMNPLVSRLLLEYMEREAGPTLRPIPGIDLEVYRPQLIERFSNPAIGDTVARLCAESSDRIPKWLLPVVREQLEHPDPQVALSAAIVASWARYAEGVDEQGRPIDVVDRLKERVMAAAARQGEDPLAFLRDEELFDDLADRPAFTGPYLRALGLLHEVGAEKTLEAVLADLP